MRRIFSAAFAALVLMSGIGINAMAEDIQKSGNSSQIPVIVTSEAYAFNVTVPTSFPIVVNSNGEVIASTSVAVMNNSKASVKVTGLSVKSAGGWTLKDFDSDLSGEENQKLFAMSFTPDVSGAITLKTSDAAGTQDLMNKTVANQWIIASESALNINYDAKLPVQSDSLDNSQTATVIMTVAWNK